MQASILGLNGMLDAWRANLPRREFRAIVSIAALIFTQESEALEKAA